MNHDVTQNWLELQCKMILGVNQGIVVIPDFDKKGSKTIANWPDGKSSCLKLEGAARHVFEKRTFIQESAENDGGTDRIACPIIINDQLSGVVAIEIEHRSDPQRQAALEMLSWGSTLLKVLLQYVPPKGATYLPRMLDLFAHSLEKEDFQITANVITSELSRDLGCERVSLSMLHGHESEICALSQSADFSKKQNLLRAIAAAMDEAVDQCIQIVYPPPEDQTLIVQAHHRLETSFGSRHICTMPLLYNGKIIGTLCLERKADKTFNEEDKLYCKHLSFLIGPILYLKWYKDRPLSQRFFTWSQELGHMLFGASNLPFKIIAILLATLLSVLATITTDFRITADATLEGSIQRALVAPQDGFLADVNALPGDIVKKDEVLAILDDRDLNIELVKWGSQTEQLKKEYMQAMAKHDRAAAAVFKARIAQSQATVDLVTEKLSRTRVSAPFDGIVVSGDLSQSLGAPVEQGQILYKIAPLDDYRVILNVDEQDINYVQPNQRAILNLTSLPTSPVDLIIRNITPVSKADEGRNYFQVEAELQAIPGNLRPGMSGIAKITIDRSHSVLWIWTYRLFNNLRLWYWKWSL